MPKQSQKVANHLDEYIYFHNIFALCECAFVYLSAWVSEWVLSVPSLSPSPLSPTQYRERRQSSLTSSPSKWMWADSFGIFFRASREIQDRKERNGSPTLGVDFRRKQFGSSGLKGIKTSIYSSGLSTSQIMRINCRMFYGTYRFVYIIFSKHRNKNLRAEESLVFSLKTGSNKPLRRAL